MSVDDLDIESLIQSDRVEDLVTLGKMYQYGEGVEKSEEIASEYFRKAAERGSSDAEYCMYELIHRHDLPGRAAESIEWLRRSAEHGNDRACNRLALHYYIGGYNEKDPEEAAKWFRISADNGNPDSQHFLGIQYHDGYGVEQSYKEAAKWYMMAAEQGDTGAQYDLGLMYEKGEGMEQSYEKAAEFYSMSDDPDCSSMYRLALLYHDGKGVPKDEEKAVRLWKILASINSNMFREIVEASRKELKDRGLSCE